VHHRVDVFGCICMHTKFSTDPKFSKKKQIPIARLGCLRVAKRAPARKGACPYPTERMPESVPAHIQKSACSKGLLPISKRAHARKGACPYPKERMPERVPVRIQKSACPKRCLPVSKRAPARKGTCPYPKECMWWLDRASIQTRWLDRAIQPRWLDKAIQPIAKRAHA
jgi:hypothetical protein